MTAKFSFGKNQFDVTTGIKAGGSPRDREEPFRLAVLGDFSGRSHRDLKEPLAQRRVRRVDCDTFEEVMGGLEARLRLMLPANRSAGIPSRQTGESLPPRQDTSDAVVELSLADMEGFHPDHLLAKVPSLAALVEQSKRLFNPATAARAASELQTLLANPPPPTTAEAPSRATDESNDDTLARLLGGTARAPAPAAPSGAGTGLDRLLRSVVAPSIVPGSTPLQSELLSVTELELSSQLRAILHHPRFQALESTWRAMDFLVRNFGGEQNLEILLLDVSKEELAADLLGTENLDASGICSLLRRQGESGPWTAWLGLYTFGGDLSDIEMLARLAGLSVQAEAPFLAAASPDLVGCDSFHAHAAPDAWQQALPAEASEGWQTLRALPEAAYLGLALPRFLLRQPYGKESDAIDTFPFEELPAEAPHESYLWGNPSILCGYLLAEAFRAEGWALKAGSGGEVGGLPIHKFKEDGENEVKPCAEAWLTEAAAEIIRQQGLIPVQSVRGRDAVRLASMPSLRHPPCALAGRWK